MQTTNTHQRVFTIFLAGAYGLTFDWRAPAIKYIQDHCPDFRSLVNPDVTSEEIRRMDQSEQNTLIIIDPIARMLKSREDQISYERKWLNEADCIPFLFTSCQKEEYIGLTQLPEPVSSNPIVQMEFALYKDRIDKEILVAVISPYLLDTEVRYFAEKAGLSPVYTSLEGLCKATVNWLYSSKNHRLRIPRIIVSEMQYKQSAVYLGGPFNFDGGKWQSDAEDLIKDVTRVYNPHKFQTLVSEAMAKDPEERIRQIEREVCCYEDSSLILYWFPPTPENSPLYKYIGPNALREISQYMMMRKNIILAVSPKYLKYEDVIYLAEEYGFPKQFVFDDITTAISQVREICVATA